MAGTLGRAAPGDPACAQCGQVLLGGSDVPPTASDQLVGMVACAAGCGVWYCGGGCRDAAWHPGGHELLCVGRLEAAEGPLIEFRNAAFDASPDGVLIRAGTALAAALAASLDGDAAPATALHFLESTPWWAINCAAGSRVEADRKAACLAVAGAFADAMRDSVQYFGRATAAEVEAAGRATPYKSLLDVFPAVAGALALNEVAVVLHDVIDDDDDDDDQDVDGDDGAAAAADRGGDDGEDDDEEEEEDEEGCCPAPAFDGGAVFPLVVMMNHTCPLPDDDDDDDDDSGKPTAASAAAAAAAPPSPPLPPAVSGAGQNAVVIYRSASALATVVALRRIEVGDEITHACKDESPYSTNITRSRWPWRRFLEPRPCSAHRRLSSPCSAHRRLSVARLAHSLALSAVALAPSQTQTRPKP